MPKKRITGFLYVFILVPELTNQQLRGRRGFLVKECSFHHDYSVRFLVKMIGLYMLLAHCKHTVTDKKNR